MRSDYSYDDWREFAGVIFAMLGGLGVLMCAITIPANRMEVNAFIYKVDSARVTRAADIGLQPFEGAAWRIFVAETNASIAEARYYNKTVFDLWIPDAIDDVEPLK